MNAPVILAARLPAALLALALGACASPGGSGHDPVLARSLGADEYGMRHYVFVLLKSGPKPAPAGPERSAMFAGHFANMQRLADAGTLVLAGPFDGVDGWRGMFVLAVDDIEEARRHVATDPVILHGEMVAEYHRYYGSAALVAIPGMHKRLETKAP